MARPYPGDSEWGDNEGLSPDTGDERNFKLPPVASGETGTVEVKALVRARVQAGVSLNDPSNVF